MRRKQNLEIKNVLLPFTFLSPSFRPLPTPLPPASASPSPPGLCLPLLSPPRLWIVLEFCSLYQSVLFHCNLLDFNPTCCLLFLSSFVYCFSICCLADCPLLQFMFLMKINRPFYRYGGHIELIRFKEYYRRNEHISFVFLSAFRDIFS